jgi:hypothetical protein
MNKLTPQDVLNYVYDNEIVTLIEPDYTKHKIVTAGVVKNEHGREIIRGRQANTA